MSRTQVAGTNVGDLQSILARLTNLEQQVQQSHPLVVSATTWPPLNPVDGQEVYYIADATNGVVWRFRYRAASGSSYKWEFVGGSPLATNDNGTEGSTTNFALTEPDTACRITLPSAFGGDFLVSGTGRLKTTSANTLEQAALAVASTTHLITEFRADAVADFRGGFAGNFVFTDVANSSLVTIKIDNGSNDDSTVAVNYRTLTVLPVRVG